MRRNDPVNWLFLGMIAGSILAALGMHEDYRHKQQELNTCLTRLSGLSKPNRFPLEVKAV